MLAGCGLCLLHTTGESGSGLVLFILDKHRLSLCILGREALFLLSATPALVKGE